MIRAREGELTDHDLQPAEVAYLSRALGGNLVISSAQLRVDRLAGIWVLPTGRSLQVEPRKGGGADLFAWICAVDPRLFDVARSLSVTGATHGDLVEAAARTFCLMLSDTIRRAGPRRNYAVRREERGAVRGRVDWSAYARKALPSRVPCTFWERELDTPLNRLVASVLRQLAIAPNLRNLLAALLDPLLDTFGHVPPAPPATMLDLARPLQRSEAPFEPVRRLACVLHDALGLSFLGSEPTFAFQVNLARLFEQSTERALALLSGHAPPRFQVRPQYRGDVHGEGGWSAIDALVSSPHGPIVFETKYASAFSKFHLYQVLAYMTMVHSSVGFLVYPTGSILPTRRFCAMREDEWEVHLVELDPVRIAREGHRALESFVHEVVRAYTRNRAGVVDGFGG